ncbi:MAG: putative Extracellular solute-binding protein family 5 [Candidatus Saccharibacteria bacterium]|nr:putative Extracellular solute-binding protein family 5 [Candidatus Saccharibacteria bacterium]
MAKNEPSKWRRIPKMSFSSKDLSRRMKRVEGASIKHARRFIFKRLDNFREVRRRIALWVLAIGIIIGATGLQYLWYQNNYRTTANATGGTYAEAVLGPVDTLNPIFAKSSAEETVGELLFSRLVTYDKSGRLNYDLADSMNVSPDGKTYSFTIRPDARWDDGSYVRARDVVFTVNVLKDPASRSTITGWDNVIAKEIDSRTVAFELPAVYAAFPHALRFLPILPEHILRDVEPAALREDAFSSKPTGSGPFTLRLLQEVDAANGRKIIHLAKSDSYFKGTPKLDRVQLHVYQNIDAIKRALNTSEVNAATDLTVTDSNAINTERYAVEHRPVNSGVYALMNTTSPVLQDKKVRQALQAGTDTKDVRSTLSKDLPQLYLPFIDNQISGNIPVAPVYDVVRANQLLDEAGWVKEGTVRMKGGQPLTLSVVTTKNNDFETALEILAKQWRTLGVTVTTNIVDPSDQSQNVVQKVLQPRQYDVLLYQLTIGGDPDVYAYWHSSQAASGLNFSNYTNPISDDALVSARSRVEADLRNAKYTTFANQWLADAPAIGLYQATMQYVHTKSIHAVSDDFMLVSSADRYGDIRFWSVGDRMVFATP